MYGNASFKSSRVPRSGWQFPGQKSHVSKMLATRGALAYLEDAAACRGLVTLTMTSASAMKAAAT
jgi:hypothetical protein